MEKSSTLDYINQMFPIEASLSGVEPLMQKVHNEIRVVDTEILAAVRQQSNSGTKAKEDLAAATRVVQELMYKVREIKTKAEQSETMVQEICRDIKKLDFAKKHITTKITALHRLNMLVSAIEQLQVMASKRQYKEASAQLELRYRERDRGKQFVAAFNRCLDRGKQFVPLKGYDSHHITEEHLSGKIISRFVLLCAFETARDAGALREPKDKLEK
ncbi:vacuolar protein sorting-associated protein 53 A-like [Lactuca sativa]|uniref:vacuolar protein sorting-associated protein 53 A-like n=1 Tax=Lactuca sativa TaxID=4236 RepID=UPI0022B02BA1|nr:vacuolar protein sorting-associated protein 53 A-like [Lactuca sativa]